jgi:23S rRNA pseudouridine1911/1915/1917 synthase
MALTHLAKQFFDRTTNRHYYALVWGDLKENATITGNVGRSLKNRKVMTVFPNGDYGKHAVTHYKILERFGYVTLVECKLETGRTHQIRVHFQHIGNPLFNDHEYGGNKILKGTISTLYKRFVENCFELLPGQALHAKTLGFVQPTSKQQLSFDSELPSSFNELLSRWRNYSVSN